MQKKKHAEKLFNVNFYLFPIYSTELSWTEPVFPHGLHY